MTRIRAIDSHMDDSTYVVAVVPTGTDAVHHLRISHTYHFVANAGTDALASHLLDIGDLTAVGSLVGEGVAQGRTDGMGREVFDMSGQVEQLVFVAGVGMDGLDGKLAMREGARLVEHDGIDLCQDIDIVGTLDQNTLTRGTANAAKECPLCGYDIINYWITNQQKLI